MPRRRAGRPACPCRHPGRSRMCGRSAGALRGAPGRPPVMRPALRRTPDLGVFCCARSHLGRIAALVPGILRARSAARAPRMSQPGRVGLLCMGTSMSPAGADPSAPGRRPGRPCSARAPPSRRRVNRAAAQVVPVSQAQARQRSGRAGARPCLAASRSPRGCVRAACGAGTHREPLAEEGPHGVSYGLNSHWSHWIMLFHALHRRSSMQRMGAALGGRADGGGPQVARRPARRSACSLRPPSARCRPRPSRRSGARRWRACRCSCWRWACATCRCPMQGAAALGQSVSGLHVGLYYISQGDPSPLGRIKAR